MRLSLMLHQAQHRYDRLLEAPRPAPEPPALSRPGLAEPPREPRGAIRQRIRALLGEHPEGLAPAQVRQQLGITKDLRYTMHAMWRDGLLQRMEYGRYEVASVALCEPEHRTSEEDPI